MAASLFKFCIYLLLLATGGLTASPSPSPITHSDWTATSVSLKTHLTHHPNTIPDLVGGKSNDTAVPKKKKKPENLTVKFCNNENFHQDHGVCMNHHTVESKCKSYSGPAPFTAMSFPNTWKCTLYGQKRCSTAKRGRSVLLEEPTINIGAALNDKVQSFRCVKRFADDAPRASVYMCTNSRYRGRCQNQTPFVGECLDLRTIWRRNLQSFEPGKGFRCLLFEHPRCNVETAGVMDMGSFNNRASSFKCFEHSLHGKPRLPSLPRTNVTHGPNGTSALRESIIPTPR